MYLRTLNVKKKDGTAVKYLSLAKSERVPGKKHPRTRNILNLGQEDEKVRSSLERVVKSIQRYLYSDGAPVSESLRDLKIQTVHDLGIVHVVREFWADLGMGEAIRKRIPDRSNGAPHELALLAMTAHRLDQPGSKLGCYERWLERVWLPECRELSLHHLYQALDVLAEIGPEVEHEVFRNASDLFDLDVDLIFYDGTTAWFETPYQDQTGEMWNGQSYEAMRKRGYSKEGRSNDPQVVIALAVTRHGFPVKSWVFPGNTVDVTTVRRIKEDLRYLKLNRAVFVGDAGMYSKSNLQELCRDTEKFIIATPISRVKEIRGNVISRGGRYSEVAPGLKAKQVVLGEGESRRRYVLCHSEIEAKRCRAHRKEVLETLKTELQTMRTGHSKEACKKLASKRFGRYLSEDGDGRLFIDQKKVDRIAQLDGKFVLQTNDHELPVQDVVLGYKGLWIIESCFRKLKTTGLGLRPMFHWTPRRIVAHVRLCVLSLMIQRAAEMKANMTWMRIADSLDKLKSVEVRSRKESIVLTSELDYDTMLTLQKLGVPRPPDVLS